MPTLVLFSHHRPTRAACWMVWMSWTVGCRDIVRSAFLSLSSLASWAKSVCCNHPRSQGRADVLDLLLTYTHRASRVSARTRSPSTRQRRMSASRRATQRQTPASPRCRTVMRRPRRSCRSQSGSMSSARWRSSSTWTTQLRFCVRVRSSSRYVYPAPPACIIPSSSTRNFHLYVFLKKIRFRCLQPGGHLFLSTIARTPLSYLLTILAAEKVFRLVEPGTHTFSKFVNPDELVGFFAKPLTQGARPWISRTYAHGLPTRVEAEVRGIVYVPWRGDWVLAPRSTTLWSTQANYLFWVRRPKDIP